jgi:hypothetical protein
MQPGPVYAGVPVIASSTRVARHLQVAGILWIAYAFERTLTKLAGLLFVHTLFSGHTHNQWDWWPMAHLSAAFWPVAVVSLLIGFLLSLLTGYALLTRQPWGRVIAIVTAVLALFHPILGTALGIYTLWLLAPAASGYEYAALVASAPRT